MTEKRTGMLLALTGPSGAGKGTLGQRLLKDDPSFVFSVSYTTRAPRPGEIQDVSYHFVDQATYDRLLAEGAFLEHFEVHGNCYATPRRELEEAMAAGKNVLLDIDVQGASEVMRQMPDTVGVFILSPSMRILRDRLVGRHTEKPEEVERRMRNAVAEIERMHQFAYIIVNDEVDAAYARLQAIVQAEKIATCRYFPTPEDLKEAISR